jgi:hypothetical protein
VSLVVVAVLIGLGDRPLRHRGLGRRPGARPRPWSPPPRLRRALGQLERAVAADPADLASLQGLAAAYVDRAVRDG